MIENVLLIKHKELDSLLDYFFKNITDGLKLTGLNAIYLDIDSFDAEDLRGSSSKNTCLFTINSSGLFPRTYDKLGMFLNLKKTLTIDFFLDHPNYRWFWNTNGYRMPEKYVALFNEPDHISFMNDVYSFTNNDFFPLAGKISDNDIDYDQKENAIVFTGNYKDEFISEINGIRDFNNIFKEIIENPDMLVEDAFKKHNIPINDRMKWLGTDGYLRCYYRKNLFTQLAKTGIPMYIFGDGWDFLKNFKNVKVSDFISPWDCIDELSKRTICVNIMPWTKRGSHDRVFDASLNGTMVITDPSEYFQEVFTDKENIVFYDLHRPYDLVKKAVYYYNHPNKTKKIAKNAMSITRGIHDWDTRCKMLADIIKKWDNEINGTKE